MASMRTKRSWGATLVGYCWMTTTPVCSILDFGAGQRSGHIFTFRSGPENHPNQIQRRGDSLTVKSTTGIVGASDSFLSAITGIDLNALANDNWTLSDYGAYSLIKVSRWGIS